MFDNPDEHLAPDRQLRLFVALFRMPTHLPLRHGDTWTFHLAGDLGEQWSMDVGLSPVEGLSAFPVNLRFPQASVRIWQPTGISNPIPFEAVQRVAGAVFPSYENISLPEPNTLRDVEPYQTVVEVVTQLAQSTDDADGRPLTTICFDRCLLAVNQLVTGVANATMDPELHALTPEELDPVSIVASRPLDAGFDVSPALFLVNWRIPFQRSTLSDAEYVQVRSAISGELQGHPFLEYARLKRSAERALVFGDYSQAAILAAVAGEVLLNSLLRAMLIELGRSAEITSRFSDDQGMFTARLRREYAPLLGGRWLTDDPSTEVGQWVEFTQRIRNRVVHAGHQPTGREARNALEGSMTLESFVMDRVASLRYRYPKAALSLLGQSGLARRNMWNRRMQRTASTLAATLPDFWQRIRDSA